MKKILVLSGTSDGNNIACLLSKLGYQVICTSTTDLGIQYAKKFFAENACNVIAVKEIFDNTTDLLNFVKSQKIDLIVDSTHPYAENIKKITLSLQDKMLIIRYERPDNFFEYKNIIYVDSHERAIEKCGYYDNIFLTIGTKNLQNFKVLIDNGKRLFVRILPIKESLQKCLNIGLTTDQIILEKGPFSIQTNIEHFSKFNAQVVVSKDSGKEGGIQEKIEACRALNIPIIIIKKRTYAYTYKFSSIEKLIDFVQNFKGEGW